MAQCTAKSKRTGERCKRFCAPGKTVCKWHGGNSKGAPKGSKRALKHGAYETISLETMFPEEIEYANSVSLDPLTTLREQLRFLRVKEARIAKRMKTALENEMNVGNEGKDGKKINAMVTTNATQTKSENAQGEKSVSVTTSSETHEMHYLRLEQAHTIVIDQIRRVLDSIYKIESEAADGEMNDEPITVRIVSARVEQNA